SWSVAAAFVHYWTPSVRQAIFGSYGRVDLPGFVNVLPLAGVARGRQLDYSAWRVGTNLYWSPVPGFDIGGEIAYTKGSYRGGVGANLDAANVAAPDRKSIGQWHGMLRIQRGF
ncbi:MAG: porin, partial [Beijerinckiaceae bacterium]